VKRTRCLIKRYAKKGDKEKYFDKKDLTRKMTLTKSNFKYNKVPIKGVINDARQNIHNLTKKKRETKTTIADLSIMVLSIISEKEQINLSLLENMILTSILNSIRKRTTFLYH